MDPADILGTVLRGALGGRSRKRSRRTMGAMTRGALANPQTLLTMAGVAWGVYETWKSKQGPAGVGGPAATGGAVPPVPAGPASSPAAPADAGDGVVRLVRLMVSAARADGELHAEERAAIIAEAAKAGVGSVVEAEIAAPRPLAQIVAGVSDPAAKAELYRLAFAIVRADEGVSGAERIYLAQLAHSLGLAQEDVARIEAQAAATIDSAQEEKKQ